MNLNTIYVMLSPKTDLTLGDISLGMAVKLILLPLWFLIMASLFSNFDSRESILYSATVSVLYLSWYFGIPAPDGWSVIRTQYPHRAFAMLLLVPLIREMRWNSNIIILLSSLFWLSLEPEVFFEPIFRYEHAARSTVACILFLVLLRIQESTPKIRFELDFFRKSATMSLSLVILGFWGSFNLVKFPNSDFGVMFFASITLLIVSFSIIKISEIHQSSKLLIFSICLGVLSGHLMDLRLGNYHESSFLFCTLIFSFLCFQLMESESFVKYGIRFSLWILFILLVVNAIAHSLDPRYVTPLMIPGFPVL